MRFEIELQLETIHFFDWLFSRGQLQCEQM